MSSRQRAQVTTDAQGSPHVEAPRPGDASLYGNAFLNQLWGLDGSDPLTDPYSDLTGPSPHEREERRMLAEMDPNFQSLPKEEKDRLLSKNGPGYGFAATRIGRHYGGQTDIPGMTEAERNRPLDLDSDEGRLGALSGMRQNGNSVDPNGGMRCGASSMVGAALYGGGKQGLQTLLDSMAEDRKKAGLPPLSGEGLEAVKKKLADPQAKITPGDLDTLQSATYEHFSAGKDGVNGRKMNDFVQGHKGMRDMFAAKDMGLDGIDLSGDGRSEHLVLGIGHDRSGNRKMVYDPQGRQDKEGWGDYMDSAKVEELRRAEKAKMQAKYDALNQKEDAEAGKWFFKDENFDYVKEMDLLDAQVEANVRTQQFAYRHDSQLIVDPGELRDYGQATDYRVGAKGIQEHDAQTKATPNQRPGW